MLRMLLILMLAGEAYAQNAISLKDYLAKASTKNAEAVQIDGNCALLNSTELRVGTVDERLRSLSLRFTPYSLQEYRKHKELTRVESELLISSQLHSSVERTYELWMQILGLYYTQKSAAVLKGILVLSDQIIASYEANPMILAEKPENYIKEIENRQEAKLLLRDADAKVQTLRSVLADAAGLPDLNLDFSMLASPITVDKWVSTWATNGSTPNTERAVLKNARASLVEELEIDRRKGIINFLDVGSSLKNDGSRDSLEISVGLAIPIFSGEFKAKEFELARERAEAQASLQVVDFKDRALAAELKSHVIFLAAQLNGISAGDIQERMLRIQRQSGQSHGLASFSVLSIKLAIERFKLRTLEVEVQLYEEYLTLARMLGHLKTDGTPLLEFD